jgi:hypothetical protein
VKRLLVLGAVLVAFGLPLEGADEDHPYERSGWALTGSERGGQSIGPRAAPVTVGAAAPVDPVAPPPAAAPAPAPTPKPAATATPEPEQLFERSPGFEPRVAPRSAWTSGDKPKE